MKKRIFTFAAGMLTMALIGSVSIGALAASGTMTITVDPISIQVNGQTFQPKDANGNDVPMFAYNGTTYAPLRALAEAYGLVVGYDAVANMATVTGVETPTQPNNGIKFYPNSKVPMLENIIDVSYADIFSADSSTAYYYDLNDLNKHGGASVINQFDAYLTSLGYEGSASPVSDDAIIYIDKNGNYGSLAVFMEELGTATYFAVLVTS